MVVVDTSTLLFWTLDSPRLSRVAAAAIQESDRVVVSSISIWEIGLKVSRGRLHIPLSIEEFADRLFQIDVVEVSSVDVATWIKSVELQWEHRDPADRVIVATAMLHGCPLVTSDEAIRAFYPRAIW